MRGRIARILLETVLGDGEEVRASLRTAGPGHRWTKKRLSVVWVLALMVSCLT